MKATGQKAALPSKIAGTSRKESAATPINSDEQAADRTTEATRATTTTVTENENDSSTDTGSSDLTTSQTEERPVEKTSKVGIFPFDFILNGKMHEKNSLVTLAVSTERKSNCI